ncbi:hypothetical protein TVAG_128240 [Trichomonas vaginalis G3]|uniref:CDC45-like protein n=1 Tax=Trichomonas vaginalis (strain ATCC PRA-98 / G3) TaxID=412133 RepID=A2EBI5_TRIV3|nr:mitotic DNA replication preinitiation complex assembly [Trichomonas vaginalis G3]EAY10015.1 hypothetical protein TVAG_128240 [Trichomonas vaginalis G3]KAI5535087.1 mitotic DNA replication preinitiation complex assembly [Trichomonas vaginalis G3]|eukprot:XP_001322238.1 hypothetical protein [Trichomonas vaginalis G3]
MIILSGDLRTVYDQIMRSSSSGTVSVLVFVPYNVDSIAAKSILFDLFKRDDILAHFSFVRRYAELDSCIKTHVTEGTLPSSVFFINCAGAVSLLARYEGAFNSETKAYIIESHRPIHPHNIDSRNEFVNVFDVANQIDTTLSDEEQQMNESFADPASIQAYALAVENGLANSQVLWFAILGLTEHFILGHIDNNRYETLLEIISNEVSRLSNGKPFTVIYDDNGDETVRPDTGIQVPVFQEFAISSSTELRCPLLRQWTLEESLHASTFIASRLRLWTESGQENLQHLLATTGIKLKQARQTYIVMDSEVKDTIVERFDRQIDTFNLAGFTFPSFTLRRGYETELSAADVVLALRAQLCTVTENSLPQLDTFSGMRFLNNPELRHSSMEAAKKRAKSIVKFGTELLSRRNSMIINSQDFWTVTVRDALDPAFKHEPQTVAELGQFLLQALDTLIQDGGSIPIILSILDEEKDKFLVVAVSPSFEFSDAVSTPFGKLFKAAAAEAEIVISADSFDSFVCTVPAQNLPLFFDILSRLIVRDV